MSTTIGNNFAPEFPLISAQVASQFGGAYYSGFRNKIINGNFDIWQRGTSLSAATNGRYLADRWISSSAGTTIAPSLQSFTLGQTDVPGEPISYHRCVVVTSAGAANFGLLGQYIESVRSAAGKKVTVTFYAKADASKNIGVFLQQTFGTGGSPSATVQLPLGLKALTTAWQKFSIVTDVPSIVGKTLGTGGNDSLGLFFWFDSGSTNASAASNVGQQSGTFDIAHVSVVEGDVSGEFDPFSARNIQQELALCQRYYEKTYDLGVNPGTATSNGAIKYLGVGSTTVFNATSRFVVTKRAIPTMTVYSPFSGTAGSIRNDSGAAEVTGCIFSGISTTSTGHIGAGVTLSGTSQYSHHWTADSELS
jgi:hypothetical protein